MQHCIGVTGHTFGVDLSNASGTNESYSQFDSPSSLPVICADKVKHNDDRFSPTLRRVFPVVMETGEALPPLLQEGPGRGKDLHSIGLGCVTKSDVIRGRYPQTRNPVGRPHPSAWLCS